MKTVKAMYNDAAKTWIGAYMTGEETFDSEEVIHYANQRRDTAEEAVADAIELMNQEGVGF